MKISYAITVCNEHKEIKKLLTFLFEHKRREDQVVVQMDTKATKEVWNACELFENRPFRSFSHTMSGDELHTSFTVSFLVYFNLNEFFL